MKNKKPNKPASNVTNRKITWKLIHNFMCLTFHSTGIWYKNTEVEYRNFDYLSPWEGISNTLEGDDKAKKNDEEG